MQIVHISKNVKLIDSPGIVASPSNPPASMALRSLQVEEGHEGVLDAVKTLLKQCDKTQVRKVSVIEEMSCALCSLLNKLVALVTLVLIVPDYASI